MLALPTSAGSGVYRPSGQTSRTVDIVLDIPTGLDARPELLFALRQVLHTDLTANAGAGLSGSSAAGTGTMMLRT